MQNRGSSRYSTIVFTSIMIFLITSGPVSSQTYAFNHTFLSADSEEEINYADYQGKPLLIDLFATWCEPCRVEVLHIQEIHRSTDDINVLSISIDPNTDTLSKIREFRDEFEAQWEFGLDHNEVFRNDENYNLTNLPYLLLFDSDGQLVREWQGITPVDKVYAELDNEFGIEVEPSSDNPSDAEIIFRQLTNNIAFQISAGVTALLIIYIIVSNVVNYGSKEEIKDETKRI